MMRKIFLELTACLAMFAVCCTAYADFVVVINAKSQVNNISKDQIAQFFLGATNTFSPIDLTEGSPIRTEFYKTIADRDPPQVRSVWAKLVFTGKAKPPKQFNTSEEVRKQVASDINAIGYIEKSAVDSSVKVVYPPN